MSADADVDYGLVGHEQAPGIVIDYVEPSSDHVPTSPYEFARPPWQSWWRRFLHNLGLCPKALGDYTCHARNVKECP